MVPADRVLASATSMHDLAALPAERVPIVVVLRAARLLYDDAAIMVDAASSAARHSGYTWDQIRDELGNTPTDPSRTTPALTPPPRSYGRTSLSGVPQDWSCRAVLLSQTCDVFTQNSFGVGDVLGDQLLISVLSGGNQLQQDFDVLSLGCPMRQRHTRSHGSLHIAQHRPRLRRLTGRNTTVVVIAGHLGGRFPFRAQIIHTTQQDPQSPPQQAGIPTDDMRTPTAAVQSAQTVRTQNLHNLARLHRGRHTHPCRPIQRIPGHVQNAASNSGVTADPSHQIGVEHGSAHHCSWVLRVCQLLDTAAAAGQLAGALSLSVASGSVR